MKKLFLFLLTLQCGLPNIGIAQQAGDLDNSFGTGGKAVKPFTPWVDITIQPDGKLLVVSNSNIIARYNINGVLDASFGINGIDTIKLGSVKYSCNAVGIQPDGKILVAGGPSFGNSNLKDFLLIRYNTDGSADSTFDGDGGLVTDLDSGSDDYAYELAIQTDGKIIVAGSSDTKLALSRYHSNGSLDSTFDNDGILTLNSITVDISNNWSHAVFMKLQPDGKVLVGSARTMTRINPDGSTDNSFGTTGTVWFDVAMNDLTMQPDGKILLAGGQNSFGLARLDTNGYYDNSFGTGGTTGTNWLNSGCSWPRQKATSVVLQPDGRILAGGYNMCCVLGNCREFVLIRYNPNGSLDSSFSSDGKVTTSFSQFSHSESHASVLTPDLKIVLAGFSYDVDYGGLAQYHLGPMLDVNSMTGNTEHLVITPNPTTDWIKVETYGIENGLWHFEIRDLTGRSILQEDIMAVSGSIQRRVSLESLPPGIYVLQLDNGKKRSVSRVAKY